MIPSDRENSRFGLFDRSTESIDSVAKDDILLSASFHSTMPLTEISIVTRTAQKQSQLIFYNYVSYLRFAKPQIRIYLFNNVELGDAGKRGMNFSYCSHR